MIRRSWVGRAQKRTTAYPLRCSGKRHPGAQSVWPDQWPLRRLHCTGRFSRRSLSKRSGEAPDWLCKKEYSKAAALRREAGCKLPGAVEKRLFAISRAIFQSRRKVITNSLKFLGKPNDEVLAALAKVQVDPQIRGDQLGLEKLMELAKAFET